MKVKELIKILETYPQDSICVCTVQYGYKYLYAVYDEKLSLYKEDEKKYIDSQFKEDSNGEICIIFTT